MKKTLLLTLICVLGLFGNLNAQEENIIIGSGSGNQSYTPTNVDSYTSVTQQIFLAEEMQNKTGKITSVSFKSRRGGTTRHFKVYMSNTDKTYFTGMFDWVTLTSENLVFDGDVKIAGTNDENGWDWFTITFTEPFVYKKDKNLLLCVNDVTGGRGAPVARFATDVKTENRLIYGNGWSDAYADATFVSGSGTLSTNTNHVQFTIVNDGSGEELEPAPAIPANVKTEALSDSQIKLTWDASENATSYKVYQRDIEEAIAIVSTTSYIVEGLDAETGYCFTVTAVKDQESEKSDEVCQVTQPKPATPSTFVFDFNDGTKTGMRVFQGSEASHLCPNWSLPQDFPAVFEANLLNYFKGNDGTYAVFSMTNYILEDKICVPDNYIVTENPYLITETSTLEWDIRQAGSGNTDQYAIVVSENGTDFENIWYERYSDTKGETKAFSLKDYAGKELYIGFHHYQVTDGFALCLDNIKLVTESTITPVDPIDPTAPSTPDNVKAIAFSESTIKLTWNAAQNALSYNIYKGDESVAQGVKETNYMVKDLKPETNYCFTVTAVNENGKESAKSSEVCATTFAPQAEAPAAPANLKATQDTETTIRLTWDAVADADVYNVYQGTLKLVSVAETTHLVTGLQAGKEYCFTVTALNKGGESPKSEEACATTLVDETIEKPATPQNFKVEATVHNELTLSWDAVADAKEYNVYEGDRLIGTIEETSVDITELENGKEYCFAVTALNKGGESDRIEECGTTLVLEAPVLTATAESDTTIVLSWDAVTGASSYNIYYGDEVLAEKFVGTTATFKGFNAGKEYCFTVTAVNVGGESEKSNEACATTLGIKELSHSFNIYPNPVNNNLYIESEKEIEKVVIYNITGVAVYDVECRMNDVELDVANLNSGVYFVKIITDNGEVVKRFVKK